MSPRLQLRIRGAQQLLTAFYYLRMPTDNRQDKALNGQAMQLAKASTANDCPQAARNMLPVKSGAHLLREAMGTVLPKYLPTVSAPMPIVTLKQ